MMKPFRLLENGEASGTGEVSKTTQFGLVQLVEFLGLEETVRLVEIRCSLQTDDAREW